MPRPPDTPDVAASKTLSYILRHGAEKEFLHIRSDGYVNLNDVLARPKMRGVDVEMVLRIVEENAKQRFELFWGYDPSPPRPKIKPGHKGKGGQGKGKGKAKPLEKISSGDGVSLPTLEDGKVREDKEGGVEVDAAALDDIRQELQNASIEETPVELPLVQLPLPSTSSSPENADHPQSQESTAGKGEYFIRARQGHSIKLDSTSHLEEVTADPESRARAGLLVHGTKSSLWETIRDDGLSRMTRQHIHLAPSLTGPITPRPNSTLLIYLDLDRLLERGIKVYISGNGVVLTPGDEEGKVDKGLWKMVEKVEKGEKEVIWLDGREVSKTQAE